MADEPAPAGWQPDPYGESADRYWDGVGWTGYVRAWRVPSIHERNAKRGLIVAAIAGALAFGAVVSAVDPGPGETQSSSDDQFFIAFAAVFCIAALFATVEFIVAWSQRRAAQRDAEVLVTSLLAPAGWYRDPEHTDRARYWTGTRWSDSHDEHRDGVASDGTSDFVQ